MDPLLYREDDEIDALVESETPIARIAPSQDLTDNDLEDINLLFDTDLCDSQTNPKSSAAVLSLLTSPIFENGLKTLQGLPAYESAEAAANQVASQNSSRLVKDLRAAHKQEGSFARTSGFTEEENLIIEKTRTSALSSLVSESTPILRNTQKGTNTRVKMSAGEEDAPIITVKSTTSLPPEDLSDDQTSESSLLESDGGISQHTISESGKLPIHMETTEMNPSDCFSTMDFLRQRDDICRRMREAQKSSEPVHSAERSATSDEYSASNVRSDRHTQLLTNQNIIPDASTPNFPTELSVHTEHMMTVLNELLNYTPQEVLCQLSPNDIQACGMTATLLAGFTLLTRQVSDLTSQIRAQSIAISGVAADVARLREVTSSKISNDQLQGEIGVVHKQVTDVSRQVNLVQRTLELLLKQDKIIIPDQPPPSSAGTTYRPPPDNPTPVGLITARRLPQSSFRQLSLREKLAFRRSGGIVEGEETTTSSTSLPSTSQSATPNWQMLRQPIGMKPIEQPLDEPITPNSPISEEKEVVKTLPKTEPDPRIAEWKQQGVAEYILKIDKGDILPPAALNRFFDSLDSVESSDKKAFSAWKIAIKEEKDHYPRAAGQFSALRACATKEQAEATLYALMAISDGCQR